MATRRQLRTERDEALYRAATAEARTRNLEKRLAAAGETRALGSDREQRQADRIIALERRIKVLQQRYDDATSQGAQYDADLDAAGRREQARRGVQPGVSAS